MQLKKICEEARKYELRPEEKRNQSIETNLEKIEVMQVADKVFRRTIINILNDLIEHNERNGNYKNTWMKNMLGKNNVRLDAVEEKNQ